MNNPAAPGKPGASPERMAALRAAKAAKVAKAKAAAKRAALEAQIAKDGDIDPMDLEDIRSMSQDDEIEAEAKAAAAEVRARRLRERANDVPPDSARAMGRLPREETRKPIRAGGALRDEWGRVAALSRDGELLSRKVTDTGDKFSVSPDIIPVGWTYQWIEATALGQQQRNSHYFQNGWRPVPAARHDGLWMSPGYKGNIELEGLLLVERPKVLTDDARAEELMRAKNQLRTQNDQFKPRLPGARDRSIRGTGLVAKRTIEGMPTDVGRPEYQIDADEGLV